MYKNISFTFFSKLLNALLGFMNALLITQFLGADGKGIISLFMASVSLCILFSQLIGGNVLVYLSSRMSVSTLLLASYMWSICMSTLLSVTLYTLELLPAEYLIECIVISFFYACFHAHLFILLGKEKSNFYNFLIPIPLFLQVVLGAFLFILFHVYNTDMYIENLIYVFGLSFLGTFFCTLPHIKSFALPNKAAFLSIWRMGKQAQFSNILFFINNRIFFYALAFFFIETQVGIYSVAIMIIEAVLIIGNSFSLILYAHISNTASIVASRQLCKKYMFVSFSLTLLVLGFIAIIPTDVYALLFGTEFSIVKKLILYLSPGALFMSIYYISSSYFSGIGKYSYNNYAVGLGLIFSILTGIVFLPTGDIFTAAIITSIAFCTISLCSLAQFLRKIQLPAKAS